ncbi:hypothetical protein K458DRAFT_381488 [Lentithecium fluviatile CBS 122367]|uniref:Zn(2)-C6 fungal-type domain-containing protein n=1 Tax=Lentithecium fluviatile CBS 122367 TaxID=1168545 RepID=A0A6G1JM48_9PLEO|nr:hypothetical protein K458DRAFT_381488 [Lentithecium fluviatile CBS 122367]
MPKQRSTCTRCSMKRQKCDRQTPCSRCVQNKEAHLCTTEWTNGYNPAVHRKYPRKSVPPTPQSSTGEVNGAQIPHVNPQAWSSLPNSGPGLPLHLLPQVPEGAFIPSIEPHDQSKLPNPSSTNVDFVTYGRSDVADVSMGTLLQEKEAYARKEALMEKTLNQNRTKTCMDDALTNSFSPAAQSVEVFHLQSLLPHKYQVLRMVDYHDRCMSYWTGGIYHAPSFRKSLLEAYGESDEIDLRDHDWRWAALLFSILSGAMIGSPEADSAAWGFSDSDKLKLSRAWGNAQVSCLHLGDYASRHHIYSVQSILNMHTSEHLVGSTKEWAAYQAASTVIARGLGLHKLGRHPDDGKSPLEMTAEQKDALLQREVGRRVWNALSAQDWLCSTSQGMYSLQKRHFSSLPPGHFDEETMMPVRDDNTPTYTHISNYLHEIAYTLVRYLDDMLDAPDLSAKYHVVLRYDAIMRAMPLEKIPKFLDPRTPYNPAWPQWTAWARRSYQASSAHKIIMIHQSFLGKSFKDPRFMYSRWACLSSAKIIIEAMDKRHPEEPQWWVEQAFVVTAGLCLGLDLFHRSESDAESTEHQTWLEKAIKILEQWPTSSVAAHGIRLLTSLLQEYTKKLGGSKPDSRPGSISFPHNIAPQALAAEASETPVDTTPQSDPIDHEPWANADYDVDMLVFEDLLDGLPMQTGLDNNAFYESMLSLTNPF